MNQRFKGKSLKAFVEYLLALNKKSTHNESMSRDIKNWALGECELWGYDSDLASQEIDKQMLENLLQVLEKIKIDPVRLETDVVDAISQYLSQHRIMFRREAKLSQGSRVDFLVDGGVAIEVKKGKPNTRVVSSQLMRYASSSKVNAIILVSERGLIQHLTEANGKPVRYIALSHNWGVTT